MKISVQPLYPTGSYLNVRLGIEMDVSPNQTTGEAINECWDALTAIHRTRYPHLYTEEGKPKYEMYKGEDEMKGTQVRDIEPVDSVQASLDEINKCTEMDGEKGLNSLWLISKGNLTLSKAWKEQEKKIKG